VNLTLACSQSDFVRNHVNIIPAPVKDIFEKSSDEVPDRTAMKLYRSNHTVIGWKIGADINPLIYTYTDWQRRSFTLFYKNVEQEGIELYNSIPSCSTFL
jgi:hypothetical protein